MARTLSSMLTSPDFTCSDGIPALHHFVEEIGHFPPGWLWTNLANAVVGVIAGALILAVVAGIRRLRGKDAAAH